MCLAFVPALFVAFLVLCSSAAEGTARRDGKFFNIFNVVRFQNGPCSSDGSQNGTCYTQAECDARGGANGGVCAAGFGVCCIITVGCGGVSSENCTYFNSEGNVQAGACQATVCPCGNDICQLRLDFSTFVITGPSTLTESVTKRVSNSGTIGTPKNVAVTPLSAFTRCLTDTFSVSNPDGPNPPAICGTNSGEHVYVESSGSCNTLDFNFAMTPDGAPLATRAWSIKVTQFGCGFKNLAPPGCVQYFFGGDSGSVRSFNYNGGDGLHLADQQQSICVRRERANCRICWTDALPEDFAVSGGKTTGGVPKAPMPINVQADGRCCSYDAAMALTSRDGFDCVQIPGAVNDGKAPSDFLPRQSNLCGNGLGLPGKTVCSNLTPFTLNFLSDAFDTATEAEKGNQSGNRGFELVYFMDALGCSTDPATAG